jgi:hypothetical protein
VVQPELSAGPSDGRLQKSQFARVHPWDLACWDILYSGAQLGLLLLQPQWRWEAVPMSGREDTAQAKSLEQGSLGLSPCLALPLSH